MAFLTAGAGAPDYAPCQYGASKLVFRGPPCDLTGRYVAVIGGTETFGKYVTAPYPDHLAASLGMPVVNLGVANAGPELLATEAEVMRIAAAAQAVVVQVVGAHNQSNPFYTVHPRRNDRLLGVTPAMRGLYPDVDFTAFHFTRHLLQTLHGVSQGRFAAIVAALQACWVERMTAFLAALGPRTVLLWTGTQAPLDDATEQIGPRYPAFVDKAMMRKVTGLVARHLELSLPMERPAPDDVMQNLAVEAGMPGLRAHRTIADRLLPLLREIGR
ncbi:MAG: DUF6473 family protein [Rhodobacteraceae bacterium]|jgi:Domain of unknown function (DUF6473)|nr:DUF6473 family protein [Paracoccaceae bacterium]